MIMTLYKCFTYLLAKSIFSICGNPVANLPAAHMTKYSPSN